MNKKFKIDEIVQVRNSAVVPIRGYDRPTEIFSFYGLDDGEEHIVMALGDWRTVDVPLVRLHSECLTGDVFFSQKCDCGEQLDQAIEEIYKHGGFLVYLRQEGRGIGLYNKIDAYRLQSKGMDTYQANNELGFADDLRDFKVAADMLRAMGHNRVRLLSNNPQKRKQLERYGIEVLENLNTGVFCNDQNHAYLKTKVEKSDHSIHLPDNQES